MPNCYYKSSIKDFITTAEDTILGSMTANAVYALEAEQINAWQAQIEHLKKYLKESDGTIIFEYTIPRIGKRIDCVLIVGSAVYAVEFKVGEERFKSADITQVMDYALDLKNFHEESHNLPIIPILICTKAKTQSFTLSLHEDQVSEPILTNGQNLSEIIKTVEANIKPHEIVAENWIKSAYKPTPTIIEAAQALYRGHNVEEISRSGAGETNLSETAKTISEIIHDAKTNKKKAICFLTGVPGAGKTLAGLNLATNKHHTDNNDHAVFLSGNGPLVEILREALALDKSMSNKGKSTTNKKGMRKKDAHRDASKFIQNIHHFRNDAIKDTNPPHEKIVIFDEAQRAWTQEQTAKFMLKKHGHKNFEQSEPEFLISVMDRHKDWAVIVCLIGGGQEINTGEGGIQEWFQALKKSFPKWDVHVSNNLSDSEYTQGKDVYADLSKDRLFFHNNLHLAISIRSYRSEKVAQLIKGILDCDTETAKNLHKEASERYPIYLTRDIGHAKTWLKSKQRGSERIGIVATAGAIRLKPYGIHVKNQLNPTDWFLKDFIKDKADIRSSNFLENVATEYDVQGLELDWTCVAWDADLRFNGKAWEHKNFKGTKWQDVQKEEDKIYLKNSYRVLLTRARQGMIIFVPPGSNDDHTRQPSYYDDTYEYLKGIGIKELKIGTS